MSEGIAPKIQALKKMANGFRNRDNFETGIYFHHGGGPTEFPDAPPNFMATARVTVLVKALRAIRRATSALLTIAALLSAAGCGVNASAICESAGGTYVGGTCSRWGPRQEEAQQIGRGAKPLSELFFPGKVGVEDLEALLAAGKLGFHRVAHPLADQRARQRCHDGDAPAARVRLV